MKNPLIYIILIIFMSASSYSQIRKKPQNLPLYDKQKLHFGFTLGINSLDFKIRNNPDLLLQDSLYTIESQNQKGFNLGIVSNLRVSRYLDLRFIPTLVFGERHLIYIFADSNLSTINEKKKIESTLIDFPIYLKYKSKRYHNFRSYILLGTKYSLDIASQENIINTGNVIIKLKPHDLMGEIGFGMDFYLEFFKFSPQIKLSRGMLNILAKDETAYTESINNLYTNGWMFSITFE